MIINITLTVDVGTGGYEFAREPCPPIIGPVDYAAKVLPDNDWLIIGKGLFAGSILPGGNRLIFSARSPVWGGMYLSTMGGAALVFDRLGIEFINISGKAETPSALILLRQKGEVVVEVVPIDAEKIWKGHKGEVGFYALQQAVYDKFSERFDDCRILATGPAAMKTNMGAIGSAPIKKGEISAVDTWAGRGGLGSKMVRDHGIVAVIYGGDYDEPDNWRDRPSVDGEFERRFKSSMIKTDREATSKYRYEEAVNSGGTFGVNYSILNDWVLMNNYQSIFWSDEKRTEVNERLIHRHYLSQFNRETIETKSFRNCGEPCPAVCKKMRDQYKKDYEPYQALGPLSGIFDQRAAEKLNRHCDAMGFDAIQLGGIIAWIMEVMGKGLVSPKDLGLSATPRFDLDHFDPVVDSMHNADLGIEIVNWILSENAGALPDGIRAGSAWLDEKFGVNTRDLAVYVCFGETGCMVPNQYWVPGLFAPMPIMGKYLQYYGKDFYPPFELGKKSAERMVLELYSDNGGFCRFHRKWVEEILPDLVQKHFETDIDFYAHHLELARKIFKWNKPCFWETERTVDFVHTYLKKVKSDNADLAVWQERFDKDKWQGARDYWEQMLAGISSVLA